MQTSFEFHSRRSPVVSRSGIVAASQPLAVAAGLEILHQGGTAADAAVAVAAALNVTEPTSTGIGGDCFALYYHAASRQVSALNGSGRAPAALTLERLQHEGYSQHLPAYHAYTVTVPGACAGWCDLLSDLGACRVRQCLPRRFAWPNKAIRLPRSLLGVGRVGPPTSCAAHRAVRI